MELEIRENPKEISEKEKTGVDDAPVKECLDEGFDSLYLHYFLADQPRCWNSYGGGNLI